MKLFKRLAFVFVCAVIIFSCAPRPHAHGHHKVPPGQAKKITGSKSARPYAPGQLKKVKKDKPIRSKKPNRR